jgi:hypothetical protein
VSTGYVNAASIDIEKMMLTGARGEPANVSTTNGIGKEPQQSQIGTIFFWIN